MRRISYLWLATLVAGTILATGCRTSRTSSGGGLSMADAMDEATLEERAQAHAHYAAAVIHEMNDEQDLALEDYYQAAIGDPDDESLTLDVSRKLILARKTERALDLLEMSAKRPDASGAIFARLALVYAQAGDGDKAAKASQMAIKKSPRDLAGYQTLFQNQLLNGHDAEALNVLNEAAAQKDTDSGFLSGLSELYFNYMLQFPSQRQAVEPKALAVLERAAALRPLPVQLELRIADGFAMLGKSEKAAKLYEESIGHLEDFPLLRDSVRAKLADIYLRASDEKRATEQLEELIHSDPSNAQAYYLLGSIAYKEHRWKEAADNLEKAVLFRPGFEQAYYDLAASRIAEGQGDEALTTLESARAKFPENFILEFLFGVAYSQVKAYPEAVQRFRSAEVIGLATATNRLTDDFYFQYGAACERKGDYAEAERCFEKSIELSPDSAESLNYLGYMWADRGEKLEKAKSLIERALKIEPDSAAYLDSMAWVLYKLGDLKPALDYMLKAVAASEKPDAELYNHLGDIYSALNEPDKARDAWEKSVAVEPNEKVQAKLGILKKE